ncbi:antitoxin [Candidatus Mycobacterium methanotrophicum]|uniref:antitoxin n=1 Tax=Candidatus Mycobacterium methanotrophicum TaxID=2943498 RepID=UPI001C56A273|nr:antitoxin [Candidatus Mycobacterium methanotrophicum]
MATATTTRNRLAAQARQRGISIAALLDELSEQAERQAAFEAERIATLAAAEMPKVGDEDLGWGTSTG